MSLPRPVRGRARAGGRGCAAAHVCSAPTKSTASTNKKTSLPEALRRRQTQAPRHPQSKLPHQARSRLGAPRVRCFGFGKLAGGSRRVLHGPEAQLELAQVQEAPRHRPERACVWLRDDAAEAHPPSTEGLDCARARTIAAPRRGRPSRHGALTSTPSPFPHKRIQHTHRERERAAPI
jgi:hypothetical protein